MLSSMLSTINSRRLSSGLKNRILNFTSTYNYCEIYNRSFSVQNEYKEEIFDILKDYEDRKKRKQSLIGTVVSGLIIVFRANYKLNLSVKCAKSITVLVQHEKFFKKYNKAINVRKKIMAHDEEGLGRMGDVVFNKYYFFFTTSLNNICSITR